MTESERRAHFRALHARDELFVMPNPWDIGSAKFLAVTGVEALATTSAGFAWSLGRDDQQVTRNELVAHVSAVASATPLPLNVDSENCFPSAPGGVAETVRLLTRAGAAGCSIEDYDPAIGSILDIETAAARVREAADAARDEEIPIVLTARAENYLYGISDLDDTIARLIAYREAGAEVLYAPLVTELDEIAALVAAVGAPVNVLAVPGVPELVKLAEVGVRRVSTGSGPAKVAYGAGLAAVRHLLEQGSASPDPGFSAADRSAALGGI
jgi:2-methylisocitrate lyase-like PEP mutase family enzyme